MQLTHLVGRIFCNVIRRLFHIIILLEISMQEDIFYIHLVESSTMFKYQSNDNSNGSHFNYRVEGLIIVLFALLSKPSNNQLSFVPFNTIIWFTFDLEHPLVAHNTFPAGWEIISHVLHLCRATISSFMALIQHGDMQA